MMHRASSESGTHVESRSGLWSGWAGEKAEFSAALPVWNEKRTVGLIFFGTDFSEAGQTQPLTNGSYHAAGKKGTSLIESYGAAGPQSLLKLNGPFSGLLLDLRQDKILLFNDRYGLNRIHFHETKDAFYFASEAKALLKVLPGLRSIDLKSLGEFFSFGCVLQNRTLFSGISLLPPGSVWTFSRGEPIKKETYFQKETWEKQTPLEAGAFYEELKSTWRRLLPRYFRGNEQVGLSLTGGVDSRMILGWAPRSAGELPCYTFGGRYRDCADVSVSRELAGICGQKHRVIAVGEEFLARFPGLAEKAVYMSDGACDVTGSIDLYVQEEARQIAPVRVTGTNGGEILRRLVAFKPSVWSHDALAPELGQSVESARQTYAQELEGHRLSFIAFKQAPWHMGSKFILERSAVDLRMPYFDNELVALAYRTPPEFLNDNDVSLRLAAEGNPALRNVGTDRNQGNGSIPGIGQARHLFQEFTSRAEYAYDYAMPQWLATFDHVLAPLQLERLFLGRHKFAHFRVYYRDELSGYLKEVLLDPRARNRPYVNGPQLERMINRHVAGEANYTREIHKLLSAELIMRQLIEQN